MQKREQKSSGAVGCFILGMISFMLLPLYVLSIGPVVWLVKGTAWEWICVVYFPVGLLASTFRPVDQALTWYLEFWIGS